MSKEHNDIVVDALKKQYFAILSLENYPKTPDLTKQADRLEQAIVKMEKGEAFAA